MFWPEQPEFVRMASRFGATIIPFGVVGEDDICHVSATVPSNTLSQLKNMAGQLLSLASQMLLDYNDLLKVPFYDMLDNALNRDGLKLRYAAQIQVPFFFFFFFLSPPFGELMSCTPDAELWFHRTDSMGDVKDQRMHPLVLAPKLPGRFYFAFGKPIETRGRDSKIFHYIP